MIELVFKAEANGLNRYSNFRLLTPMEETPKNVSNFVKLTH